MSEDLHYFQFNKIIREKIYPVMLRRGVVVKTRHLARPEERLSALKAKLQEESEEVVEAATCEELKEELADILEVVHGFARELGLDMADIERSRCAKREEKGSFDTGTLIEYIGLPPSHPTYTYFTQRQRQYPRVTLPSTT